MRAAGRSEGTDTMENRQLLERELLARALSSQADDAKTKEEARRLRREAALYAAEASFRRAIADGRTVDEAAWLARLAFVSWDTP